MALNRLQIFSILNVQFLWEQINVEDILRELQEFINGYKQKETSAWLTRALEYNLQNSGLHGALVTVLTYENLVRSKNSRPEDLRLAHILGWCAEILVAAIVIYDDIMDRGSLRYGLPCWHTVDNMGVYAINDAIMIEHAVYVILKKNLRHLDCYMAIMETFHEVSFITVCGKNLDIKGQKRPVNEFNMDTYKTMAVNKGYYIFFLPFALAMHLDGVIDLKEFLDIFHQIGLFNQINNDFYDCFGTLEATGKVGTDIQDSKYSWLAITCMERSNDEQKQIMIDCYGSSDPEKVQRVKGLYEALDLPGIYADYEENSYKNTTSLIKQIPNDAHQRILLGILNKLYRRNS